MGIPNGKFSKTDDKNLIFRVYRALNSIGKAREGGRGSEGDNKTYTSNRPSSVLNSNSRSNLSVRWVQPGASIKRIMSLFL